MTRFTKRGKATDGRMFDFISEDEIAVYELHPYTEAEKWRLVADKWRKHCLMTEANWKNLLRHVETLEK